METLSAPVGSGKLRRMWTRRQAAGSGSPGSCGWAGCQAGGEGWGGLLVASPALPASGWGSLTPMGRSWRGWGVGAWLLPWFAVPARGSGGGGWRWARNRVWRELSRPPRPPPPPATCAICGAACSGLGALPSWLGRPQKEDGLIRPFLASVYLCLACDPTVTNLVCAHPLSVSRWAQGPLPSGALPTLMASGWPKGAAPPVGQQSGEELGDTVTIIYPVVVTD